MPALAPIAIDENSGNKIALPSCPDRRQALLRVVGADVWSNFNEEAIAGQGILIKDGEVGRFWGDRDNAAVYLVTEAGQTAIAYFVDGYSNMEVLPGTKRTNDGNTLVEIPPLISTNNSTTDLLGAGETFVGVSDAINGYGIIYINVYSDVASAMDGLKIEQSTDGTNWDHCDEFTIPAAIGKNFSINPHAEYLRVQYVNGSTGQSEFRLQTILKSIGKSSSHRIQDPISTDDDAELVKSVITGLKDNGSFDNASLTNRGQFKVSIEEYGDIPSIDAFARLRISEPFTLFDSKQLHDKQPLFWDEKIGGSATSVHSSIHAETLMTVPANSTDYVIRQTKQRFNYQPGKGQLLFMTFRSPQNTGVTCQIGPFDDDGIGNNLTPKNGIYFQCDGSLTWNIAKNGSVTESISQDNWNIDKLDGTGVSEVTLNPAATQILIIDFEWLCVGRVRVGFVIDGVVRYCHYFNHSNDDTFSSVYMSSPNLPLRYAIQGNGTNDEGTLQHICSTVISEGGQQETGILRSVDTGSTHIDANTANTTYAVVGIKLKAAYKDITVIPEFFSMINEQSGPFRWSLCLNPTIAGTFTYADEANSAVQSATGATANTVSDEGLVIDSGYESGSNTSFAGGNRKFVTSLRMGSKIDGTLDEIVLCVTPLNANEDIQASLTFRELL